MNQGAAVYGRGLSAELGAKRENRIGRQHDSWKVSELHILFHRGKNLYHRKSWSHANCCRLVSGSHRNEGVTACIEKIGSIICDS